MKIDKTKMEEKYGYLSGSLDCLDDSIKDIALNYKKRLSQSFFAISPDGILTKIKGEDFFVSKKIDGQLQVVFFNGKDIFMVGRGGAVRMGLACLEEAKKILAAKNISSIVLVCELYVKKEGRCRVYDVISALADPEKVDSLALAVFDIIKLDDEELKLSYKDIFEKLSGIVPKEASSPVHLVETELIKDKKAIEKIFTAYVDGEGGEGLVVKNAEMPFAYKVKPCYTLDAVVVGYAEGINEHKGRIKSLLFAFRNDDGFYQVVGKVGNMAEEHRVAIFKELSAKHIDADYIETDNEGVAFHMVNPEMIIEISCNDIISETSSGQGLKNNLLDLKDNKFNRLYSVSGAKLIHPVFSRIRTDKKNNKDDIPFTQISKIVYIPESKSENITLSKSELVFREVYKKEAKDKIMVQKFLIWKTNKEKENPRFPAYVLAYSNFSSSRKDPLQRDVRISSNKEQIMNLLSAMQEQNIKKGWEKTES